MNAASRPTLCLMTGRSLGFAVTFLIPVLLARFFDQTTFGVYKQIFLVHATLFALGQVGMAESLFYFLPMAPDRGGRYAFNAMLLLGVSGLVCLAILVWAGPALTFRMNDPALVPYLPLLGIYLLFTLISAVLEIVIVSQQRYLLASTIYATSDLLRAAAFVTPLLLAVSLRSVLIGACLHAFARLVATIVYLVRRFGDAFRLDTALMRTQIAYALPFALAVGVEILQANLHQYAVLCRFDAATFAIYAVGCLQIPIIELVGSSASNVMMVGMADARARGRSEEVIRLWHDTTRKLALVYAPLVVWLLLEAREIVMLLFTERYLPSVPIFRFWSLAILAASLSVDGVLRVHARTRLLFAIQLTRLALVAALILPFLSSFGLVGAVLVSLIATFTGKLIGLVGVARSLRIGARELLPWARLALILTASIGAAVPCLLLRSVVEMPAPLGLATSSALYGLVLLFLLAAAGLVARGPSQPLAGWARWALARAAGTEGTRTG